MTRLPPQPGEWIDRTRTIRFDFEGNSFTAFAGDTITSALWAAGVRVLGRSFKYHRPRGIYSFANHEVNNVFASRSATNIRGDVVSPVDGEQYDAVNTLGGVENDRARFVDLFSKMLPVGFYYKAFHTPRILFPFWERRMRAMAGLGAIDAKAPHRRTPKDYDFCDVCVIGAGPAGLSAAIAAAKAGAEVLLVDENARAGGSLTYQFGSEPSVAGELEKLLAQARALPHLRIRTSTEVAGCYSDHWIALVDEKRLTKVRAGATIFATGCIETPAVFGNNDLPGVMLASAAQRLIRRYSVKPSDRAVVLAANEDAYRAAIDLQAAGVTIAGIVDLRPAVTGSRLADQLTQAGIKIHSGCAVIEAKPGSGKKGIVAAVVAPLNPDGKPDEARTFTIDCDSILMSVGWAACDNLINQAGGKMIYSPQVEQFVPQQLPQGAFACGRVNGIFNLADQLNDGTRAGLTAAAHVGKFAGTVPAAPAHQGSAPTHPFPIFPHKHGKDFIDLDEDVQYKDIKNAVQEGFDSIELVKRYTTVGMGPGQGKIGNMNGVRSLASVLGKTINETGASRSRPFYHPVPLRHLAGKGFHPHRHTATHHWHKKAGATFMPAGAWLRPAYYASKGERREDAILAEVRNVRQGVGMIDVGTLGKIEVNGTDSAEFLERLYTGKFANMKVGTTRYLLMCDESGVIIDDGVAARLADDRFYVTATTTGADAVYREMQRWAILWKMNVVLINLTGGYGAMNLAGPLSREILAPLTDVSLDQTAFPYLGVREGTVAGAPARLMRVGFVGELGYEIHVPWQHALHVWETIMLQGEAKQIRPFGVEAQRVLRLEKAHIIIGQDTDGLTNPSEAAMDWAVKMDKPFFIGQRSLSIIAKRPTTRSLVGFMLSKGFSGELPKECHLIIRQDEIIGRVTSITDSPTLKRVVGLAFISKDQSAIGTRFTIRADLGAEVQAEVVSIPFYDPKAARQTESKPSEQAS